MQKSTLPYLLAIIFANIIWAAAGPIIKLTLDYIPVFSFLLFRFLIVCVVLVPYVYVQLKKTPIHVNDIGKILLLGIFSQSSLALIFFGYKYTTALEATIIGLLGSILSVYAGHIFYSEEVNHKVKMGLFLASVGTLFVALEPIFNAGELGAVSAEKRLLGNTLVILYALAFLMYMIWSKITMTSHKKQITKALKWFHIKPMKREYSPTLITSITFYVGLLSFIPFALIENTGRFGYETFDIDKLTATPVAGILYMALISSVLAYTLFEWGLSKIEVKDTAIYSYLQPVFTLPFAYLILGELPNQYMLIGGSIIAMGVLIAESKKS